MGYEYRIRVDSTKVASFDKFLRRQPYFESFDEETKYYNLRLSGHDKPWDGPDVHVVLEQDGIYFLDNLTSSSEADQIFRSVVDHALNLSGPITITEP